MQISTVQVIEIGLLIGIFITFLFILKMQNQHYKKLHERMIDNVKIALKEIDKTKKEQEK